MVVEKPGGGLRFCCDFRRVNAVSTPARVPMPRIVENLHELAKHKWHCSWDLLGAFHQVGLAPESRDVLAITTPVGQFRFLRMPMGHRNSGSHFVTVMAQALTGLVPETAFLYADDGDCAADTFNDVLAKMERVLTRLQEWGVQISLDKCRFLASRIRFLGHMIGDGRLWPLDDKVAAIRNMIIVQPGASAAANARRLRSLLGAAAYYAAYIPRFSSITAPLRDLLRVEAPWVWTTAHDAAVDALKAALAQEPCLMAFRPERPTALHSDFSKTGLGAVLMQRDTDGVWKACAYHSQALTAAASRMVGVEGELFAMTVATRHFAPFLQGRRFEIITDHAGLKAVPQLSTTSERMNRWQRELATFDFFVTHRPGRDLHAADLMSRLPPAPATLEDDEEQRQRRQRTTTALQDYDEARRQLRVAESRVEEQIAAAAARRAADDAAINAMRSAANVSTVPAARVLMTRNEVAYAGLLRLREEQARDPFIASLRRQGLPTFADATNGNYFAEDGIVYRRELRDPHSPAPEVLWQYVVPSTLQAAVLHAHHDGHFGGHRSAGKMLAAMRAEYWWPRMTSAVTRWVKTCTTCARRSPDGPVSHAAQYRVPPGTRPFEIVAMDVVGPLPVTADGHRYIVVWVDLLTRYVVVAPTKTVTSAEIAAAFVTSVVTRFGAPIKVVSDHAANIIGGAMADARRLFGVFGVTTTPLHQQANGICERAIGTMSHLLRKVVDGSQRDWDRKLPFVVWIMETQAHRSLGGATPFSLVHGWHPRLPTSLPVMPPVPVGDGANAVWPQMRADMEEMWRLARAEQDSAAMKREQVTERRPGAPLYTAGQLVWVYMGRPRGGPADGSARKLEERWRGPGQVIDVVRQNVYRVSWDVTGKATFLVHCDRLRPYWSPTTRPESNDESLDALFPEPTVLPPHDMPAPTEDPAPGAADIGQQDGTAVASMAPLRQELDRGWTHGPATVDEPVAIATETAGKEAGPHEFFEVERITKHRGAGRTLQYRVRWAGYQANADTWVAVDDIADSAPECIETYWSAVKAKAVADEAAAAARRAAAGQRTRNAGQHRRNV